MSGNGEIVCPFKYEDFVCSPDSRMGYKFIPRIMFCGLCQQRSKIECVGEDKCLMMKTVKQ